MDNSSLDKDLRRKPYTVYSTRPFRAFTRETLVGEVPKKKIGVGGGGGAPKE
jgi:hypothetical protein